LLTLPARIGVLRNPITGIGVDLFGRRVPRCSPSGWTFTGFWRRVSGLHTLGEPQHFGQLASIRLEAGPRQHRQQLFQLPRRVLGPSIIEPLSTTAP
jgi:hypothetical protein